MASATAALRARRPTLRRPKKERRRAPNWRRLRHRVNRRRTRCSSHTSTATHPVRRAQAPGRSHRRDEAAACAPGLSRPRAGRAYRCRGSACRSRRRSQRTRTGHAARHDVGASTPSRTRIHGNSACNDAHVPGTPSLRPGWPSDCPFKRTAANGCSLSSSCRRRPPGSSVMPNMRSAAGLAVA